MLKQDSKGKYWYHTTIYRCVLCGHEDLYKERIYDALKPIDYWQRYDEHETACSDHFI